MGSPVGTVAKLLAFHASLPEPRSGYVVLDTVACHKYLESAQNWFIANHIKCQQPTRSSPGRWNGMSTKILDCAAKTSRVVLGSKPGTPGSVVGRPGGSFSGTALRMRDVRCLCICAGVLGSEGGLLFVWVQKSCMRLRHVLTNRLATFLLQNLSGVVRRTLPANQFRRAMLVRVVYCLACLVTKNHKCIN